MFIFVLVLLPAHSKRFIVYPVQDYHSFSQRVAIVVVMLCVFVSPPQKKFSLRSTFTGSVPRPLIVPPPPRGGGVIFFFFLGGGGGGVGGQ